MESPSSRQNSPLLATAIAIIILWGLHVAADFLIPVMLASLLAFLVAPVMRGLRKLKLPEWLSLFGATLLIILPLAAAIYFSVSEIQALVQNWPKLSSSLMTSLDHFRQTSLAARLHLTRILDPAVLQSKMQSEAGSEIRIAMLSLSKILSATTLLILTLFFAVAMLASRGHLKRSFGRLLASYTSIESNNTVGEMAQMMEDFLVARTTIAVGLGAAAFFILIGFGIPYSFLLGAFLGLMTWVPVVGFFVGILPVVAVGYASGKGSGAMLAIFLAIGAIWTIQDHIITPKWVGHKLKLNFLVTYLSFFAGGLIWGAWGMILSIPLTGVLRIACSASPRLRPWAFLLGEEDDELKAEVPRKKAA